MDSLERIAVQQVAGNVEFRDYYKMTEGRMVYSDFEAPPEIMKDIKSIRDEMDLPTFIRHYDIIGIMANQLTGELDSNKDKLRVDSIDEFSQNEFIREKTDRVNEYLKAKFDFEVKQKLALKGINLDEQREFQSKEEQQQYMQFIQEESNKIVPLEYIEAELGKNFKVKAAEWGERTLEADYERFSIDYMETQEFLDYFLTGRFFRHYHVGYDFYKPERWSVENTFFSQDLEIANPQDGEYAGRLTFMSAADILSRWGSKLTLREQQKLGKVFDNTEYGSAGEKGDYTNLQKRPVGSVKVPHEQYFDHQIQLQLQEAFDTPLGETTITDENGQTHEIPSWLSDYSNHDNYFGTRVAEELRDDINVRRDLFRVTEAYWRSFKRIGYIRYRSEEGIVMEDMLTDDLLPGFLKENGIKKLNTISIEDFEVSDKMDVIAYTYIPEVWQGKKIGAATTTMSEDIYFDIKPLDFQIKGHSNIFDVKLPVAGIISSSYARKIRPYQMGYNMSMNQIFNLLEKEIGMFFLLDINFLPSEYKELGDSADILAELRDFAKDLGFIPTDTSRQNTQGQNPNTQLFTRQEISYDSQINRRAMMADMYKRLALEQIGITEQRKGNPDNYATAEGIKVGQEASYAQTRTIYSKFNEARKQATHLHLSVAQYCQGNNRDLSIFSRRSDGDLAYLAFTDEFFPLRQLGVSVVSDAKSRKSLERLREYMLNNNTLGNDLQDFAEVMVSDSMLELLEVGKKARRKAQQEMQEDRQHELALTDKQTAAAAEAAELERQDKNSENEKDRRNKIEVEKIKALGRASDKDSDQAGFEQINKAAETALKREAQEADIAIKKDDQALKREESVAKAKQVEEELKLRLAELKEKREERKSREYIATINKN